ncbi:hypothetical protein [Rosistilla ulvae]|uniref:hypothetical protein n=1 Tax=Rosistilla ulvae TaxID=1930277 RepID=UPI00119E2051|nr:hypothetical protein [Rosistilla ulvae]
MGRIKKRWATNASAACERGLRLSAKSEADAIEEKNVGQRPFGSSVGYRMAQMAMRCNDSIRVAQRRQLVD